VSIPDDLDVRLEAYLAAQETPPSLTTVLQVALQEFLSTRALRERGFQPASKPFAPTALAEKDSQGEPDASMNHDRYFSEAK
jgi:hypothetical protein